MSNTQKTLSTKLKSEEYKEFVERARQLGISPSALLRKLVLEFLEKPIEEYDSTAKLEKEIKKLKIDVRELRTRLDALSRRIMYLEQNRDPFFKHASRREG